MHLGLCSLSHVWHQDLGEWLQVHECLTKVGVRLNSPQLSRKYYAVAFSDFGSASFDPLKQLAFYGYCSASSKSMAQKGRVMETLTLCDIDLPLFGFRSPSRSEITSHFSCVILDHSPYANQGLYQRLTYLSKFPTCFGIPTQQQGQL